MGTTGEGQPSSPLRSRPGAPAPDGARAEHHLLPVHEVALLLETDAHRGLTDEEASQRLGRIGPNELPRRRGGGPVARVGRQVRNPLVGVLLASAVVTLALGQRVESGVILAVVLVNAAFGFVQESRAEAALDALTAMVRTQARVVRGGRTRSVPSGTLVPGDVVLLEAGDKVPADLRLVVVAELAVDESALTGEAVPVAKQALVLVGPTEVPDRLNMAWSGTLVTGGRGTGVVVGTGADTELGTIHRLVGTADVLATPLTRKLTRFSRVLTVLILALAALTFGVGTLRGEPAAEMFTAAVALAVGAIPEGLPAAVTITLAIGVGRMARRRAVVRRLPAVETLGSTTVICSDKTGTLTENRMRVLEVWTPSGRHRPEDRPHDAAVRWTLVAGACCTTAEAVRSHTGAARSDVDAGPVEVGDVDPQGWDVVGDPTEAALLVAAVRGGLDPDVLARHLPRLEVLPFSSERQYMATLHGSTDGDDVVLVKGAVERVAAMCVGQLSAAGDVEALDRQAVARAADGMARSGLRVLATAVARPADRADFGRDGLGGELVLTGLQAMQDPPRASAAAAVSACHAAGIDVKMITGDHALTATSIARSLGLLDPGGTDQGLAPDPEHGDGGGEVVTGAQLSRLDDEAVAPAVERASVFARVSPEQKLLLVRALQGRGHVVAMTGDGVNDAPALRQADIGVAMGKGGTEVATEAADMVLLDDDFATIEHAVEEGRGVFDNLTKFITWTLPTNMAEGFVILVAILLGTALPILPVQILWINMTTAVTLGLMLAFEPKEEGIMGRPPRDPREPLLTRRLVIRILLVSVVLVGGAWWLFAWEAGSGSSLAAARTAAVNLFVAVEAVYLLGCRSLTRSAWSLGPLSNRWLVAGVGVQALAQLAITYLPAMQTLFGTSAIGPDAWLRIAVLAVGAAAVVAVDKRVLTARGRHVRGTRR